MEKRRKVIIIAVAVILVLIVAGVLYFNLNKIEITKDYNMKISAFSKFSPAVDYIYYFYDDYIIETNYSSGVLPEGVVTNTTTTKYHFNEKIDLTELKAFLDKAPRANSETFRAVEIVEKNGMAYSIDDIEEPEDGKLTIAHAELLDIIWKLTEKASFKQVRTN